MQRKSFSMIELVFIIVILGILTAVAVPRLSLTRQDACYANLRAKLSEVETILSREYTKKFLQGQKMSDADLLAHLKTLENGNSNKCTFTVNSQTSVIATIASKTLTMEVKTDTTTKSPTITCDYTNEICRNITGKQKGN